MSSNVRNDFTAELFLELDLVSPFSLRMSPRALFTLVGSRMPLAILDHIGTQATGIEGLNTASDVDGYRSKFVSMLYSCNFYIKSNHDSIRKIAR